MAIDIKEEVGAIPKFVKDNKERGSRKAWY